MCQAGPRSPAQPRHIRKGIEQTGPGCVMQARRVGDRLWVRQAVVSLPCEPIAHAGAKAAWRAHLVGGQSLFMPPELAVRICQLRCQRRQLFCRLLFRHILLHQRLPPCTISLCLSTYYIRKNCYSPLRRPLAHPPPAALPAPECPKRLSNGMSFKRRMRSCMEHDTSCSGKFSKRLSP